MYFYYRVNFNIFRPHMWPNSRRHERQTGRQNECYERRFQRPWLNKYQIIEPNETKISVTDYALFLKSIISRTGGHFSPRATRTPSCVIGRYNYKTQHLCLQSLPLDMLMNHVSQVCTLTLSLHSVYFCMISISFIVYQVTTSQEVTTDIQFHHRT